MLFSRRHYRVHAFKIPKEKFSPPCVCQALRSSPKSGGPSENSLKQTLPRITHSKRCSHLSSRNIFTLLNPPSTFPAVTPWAYLYCFQRKISNFWRRGGGDKRSLLSGAEEGRDGRGQRMEGMGEREHCLSVRQPLEFCP